MSWASRIFNGSGRRLPGHCNPNPHPEYERDYLEVYNEYQKPVIPVGLLPPEKREEAVDGEWVEIFQWLNGKAARSVVFVGFGSECKLSRNEIYEIAQGLELSNLDFL